jgi:hypothetical protein
MTPTQLKDRRLDIEGEIKQARAMVAECEQREAEKLAAHQSAQIDTQRAKDRLEALKTECKELAQSFYDDCLSLVSDEPIAKLEDANYRPMFAGSGAAITADGNHYILGNETF